jgi:hypothetical protein
MYKYQYDTLKWIAATIVFIVCFACSKGFSAEADKELDNRLMAIRSQTGGKSVTTDWQAWEKAEAQLLDLVKDHNSPEEKGRIYSTIARMYSQSGWRSSEDPRIPKAIKYCKEALQYPLDAIDGCEMNGRLADAMMDKYWGRRPNEEFVKMRQEAITYCLTGLKLAIDHNAPKEHPEPPPPMTVYHVNPDAGPLYEDAMRKNKEQLAARKKWDFLEKLYFQRLALTQRCVTLYSHKPYATDEFKLTAEKILKGHEDVAKELIAQVEAEIARITEREAEIKRKEKGG